MDCTTHRRLWHAFPMWALLCTTLLAGSAAPQSAPDAALAATPPRGLNTYDSFIFSVSESNVTASAVSMVQHRMVELGWNYLVIDMGWYAPHPSPNHTNGDTFNFDDYSRPLPDPVRWPSSGPEGKAGFKAVCSALAAMGIRCGVHLVMGIGVGAVRRKLGILGTPYTAADIANVSLRTGGGHWNYGVDMAHPGAQAYYDSLVALLAEWGVDFIKFDWAWPPWGREVEAIAKAIAKSGRRIVLSINGSNRKWAQMYRIGGDLWDNWAQIRGTIQGRALFSSAPGAWADCDMLPLGAHIGGLYHPPEHTHLTDVEAQATIAFWCIAQSPLMFGGYLPLTDSYTISLLTNPEVLEVNSHGNGPKQVYFRDRDSAVWVSAPARRGRLSHWIALFNLADAPGTREVAVAFPDISLSAAAKCRLRDVFARAEQGWATGVVAVQLAPHGAALLALHSCSGGSDM